MRRNRTAAKFGGWYSWVGSNHRPPDPQSGALASRATTERGEGFQLHRCCRRYIFYAGYLPKYPKLEGKGRLSMERALLTTATIAFLVAAVSKDRGQIRNCSMAERLSLDGTEPFDYSALTHDFPMVATVSTSKFGAHQE